MKKIQIPIAVLLLTALSTSCRSTKNSTTDIHTNNDSLTFTARKTIIDRIDSLVRSDQFTIILDSLNVATHGTKITARSARISGKTASVRTSLTQTTETDSTISHSTAVATIKTNETSVRQAINPSLSPLRILAVSAIAGVLLAVALKIKRKK